MTARRLDCQTALVTGASGGIGRALVRVLAEHGHDVVLVARRRRPVTELAAQTSRQYGVRAQAIAMDLSQPTSAQDLASMLSHLRIRVDILVNNAGFGSRGPFAQSDPRQQFAMMQLEVVTVAQLMRLLLPQMIARGRGKVLNVASIGSYMPGPLMATYFASKAFVLSLSEAVAEEVRNSGVTVTALIVGPTRTGFAARAGLEGTRAYGGRLMDPAAVARRGYEAMVRGRPVAVAGVQNKLRMVPVRLAPRRLLAHFARLYHQVRADSAPARGPIALDAQEDGREQSAQGSGLSG